MKKENFTRAEVIKIIDDLLQRPDLLIDAVGNENTNTDAESCLKIAEEELNIQEPKKGVCRTFFPDGKMTSATTCMFCDKEKWQH